MLRRVLCGAGLPAIAIVTWFSQARASGLPASAGAPSASLDFSLLATSVVLLIPAGLMMVAVAASEERRAASVAAAGLVGVALGVLIYALIGFGLQFGGASLISDLGSSRPLLSEWSPVDRLWGPGWGIIGLDGFLLPLETLDEDLLSVFLYQAILAATAACIPLLALARRLRFLVLWGVGLMFAIFVYPVYGNWVWGGGWLSQLGSTLGLGHGFVDFAGSGTIHALGGFFALAGLLAFGSRPKERDAGRDPPAIHFPLLSLLGALLLLIGWLSLVMGKPLLPGSVSFPRLAVNVLLAACGGMLTGTMYTWFVTGNPDLLIMVRSTVASLVAISACCAFVAPWAAAIIGAVAGLFVPLTIYLMQVRLGLEDPTGAVAVHGVAGLWGLIAVGIFADGVSGQGWNGIGSGAYLDVARQGVSGLLAGPGFQADWPQQMYAQLVGVVALLILALALSWLVLRGLKSLARRVAGLRAQMEVADDPTSAEG
jgi:Amt family ammonium transporter